MLLSTPRLLRRSLLLVLACLSAAPAHAISFELDYGDGISGVLNSTATIGAGWRLQQPSSRLIGKSNLNPNVCAEVLQSCQGVFRDQIAPAQALVDAPGQFTLNADDGNLNYQQYDIIQGVAKLSQDLSLDWGGVNLFARWMFFYDTVNNDFTENHPNRLTPENAATSGHPASDRDWVFPLLRPLYFPNSTIYGAGSPVEEQRTNGELLSQIGTDFQMLDYVLSTEFYLGDLPIQVKAGRQTISWGESTLLVVNSLNQINPPNANNLFRVGFQLEEVFTPVGLFALSTDIGLATLSAFYQYDWEPLEIPAPGSFFSFIDVGTNNLGDTVNLSFGGAAEDPHGLATPQNNPLALITPTNLTAARRPDNTPSDSGQFGASLKYYFDSLFGGTEVGLYYLRYHSRLPYVSFYASDASCARREGNDMNLDASSTLEFFQACDDLPVNRVLAGGDPSAATSDAAPIGSVEFQLEYPEALQMFGISFNTSIGDWSFQGEVAYRPDAPLQVDDVDLVFAALGPTLTRCHDQSLGCTGSTSGIGLDGSNYGSSDFLDASGNNPYPDTFDVGVPLLANLGHLPGSARSFPSFVVPYRGGEIGETTPNSYVRGWEKFDTFQYNFGGTYILGATQNPIGADQVIFVFETGATHVPDLPSHDVLQIEGPGTTTHASAGADGTGADGSRRACSTNPSCHVGADGGRFNPTQQRNGFATDFAWGYRLVSIIRYESIFPGWSLEPFIVWGHDVEGTAPGPAENFVEGRKQVIANFKTRYKNALSFTLGYGMWTGGGQYNLLRDRDFSSFFVQYQF